MRGLERGQRPALLTLECQRGVVEPELAGRAGLSEQAAQRAIIAKIAILATLCRSVGVPVFHNLLVHRPDFGFPGAWIAAGDSIPIIHIYAGGPALGADGKTPYGTSALDHVSLTIKGWDECHERVKKLGSDWRAAIVPGTSLWQIFVHDPSGVMMELTFDGKAEGRPTPDIPADRVYMAGKPFGTPKAKAA